MLSQTFTPPFQLKKNSFLNVPMKLLNSHFWMFSESKKKKNSIFGYANVTENIKGMFYFIILCKHCGNITIKCSLKVLKLVTFKECRKNIQINYFRKSTKT